MSPAVQILLVGAGTYLFRISFIVVLARVDTVPRPVEDALAMIPPAVLGAIAAQSVILEDGSLRSPSIWHVAAAVSALVAWRTRSVLWCIAGGMTALWLLSAVT